MPTPALATLGKTRTPAALLTSSELAGFSERNRSNVARTPLSISAPLIAAIVQGLNNAATVATREILAVCTYEFMLAPPRQLRCRLRCTPGVLDLISMPLVVVTERAYRHVLPPDNGSHGSRANYRASRSK